MVSLGGDEIAAADDDDDDEVPDVIVSIVGAADISTPLSRKTRLSNRSSHSILMWLFSSSVGSASSRNSQHYFSFGHDKKLWINFL